MNAPVRSSRPAWCSGKVKVSRVPDGVAEYSVWGLKLPTLRQRLFRCVSIRENDDGTYAITAVQHVPEKEAIVDNGAHFDGNQSGTVNGVTPPAVQHLTAEVTADSGEYQVLARWDTPKVVKGVSFMLRRKRKLTAVCSHQTRIGNLDAHLI